MTAGGITNGMHGGLFAAEVAIEAIKCGDTSEKFLKKYEDRWDAEFGKLYHRLYRIRHALLKVPEEKVSRMIHDASKLDAQHMSLKDIFMIIMKSHPQMLLEVAPYFLVQ